MARYFKSLEAHLDQASDNRFQPVEGEIIDQSAIKLLGVFFFAVLFHVLGDFVVWAWWTEASLLGFSITWWGGCIGALAAALGLVGVLFLPLMVLIRQRLILGEDYLQHATDKGRILAQIPYRNVARMELSQEEAGKFIGIDLRDTQDADTLNKEAEKKKQLSGWHYKIDSLSWRIAMEEIYRRLNSRVQAKQSER
jgi:hypothetical protein